MMMSHRFELNQQAIKSFEQICGEQVALEQASYHADRFGPKDRIVVASVQSLNAKRKGKHRMLKFDPKDFGLLMIDEAHRAAAASYRRAINHFKQNPNLKVVGVTATPDRLDKVGLGTVFDEVASDLNIKWAVENGWLVAPKQKFVQIDGLDLSEVRTIGGDLDEKQLGKILEVEQNLHAISKPLVDIAGQETQVILFTASVQQARRSAELIRDYYQRLHGHAGPQTAVSLDGSLSPQDPRRQSIVRDFKNGNIQFLCNCGVATEGFDAPSVGLIAVARPTKSRALYTQMVGRGTRALPGVVDGPTTAEARREAIANSDKPNVLVLDFVGQAGRHDLVCTTDILAGSEDPPEIKGRAERIIRDKRFNGDTLEAIKRARAEIAAENEARRKKVTLGVDYQLRDAKTLYDVNSNNREQAKSYKGAKKISDKQKAFMVKLGFTIAQIDNMNRRQASEWIDHAIENPRNGYARFMQKLRRKDEAEGKVYGKKK